MFTLVVGPQKKVYTVHQAILSKSPFFRAASKGYFREATTKNFVLSEDDAELVHHMITYLYSGSYGGKIRGSGAKATVDDKPLVGPQRTIECRGHARLYALAEKYALPGLKKLAIKKLRFLAPIPLESLLEIAEEVYPSLPPSEKNLREFVREQLFNLPVGDTDWDVSKLLDQAWLLDRMERGGTLAVDIFMALQALYNDVKDGAISPSSIAEHDKKAEANEMLEEDGLMDGIEDGGEWALERFKALRVLFNDIKADPMFLASNVSYVYDGDDDEDGRKVTTTVVWGGEGSDSHPSYFW